MRIYQLRHIPILFNAYGSYAAHDEHDVSWQHVLWWQELPSNVQHTPGRVAGPLDHSNYKDKKDITTLLAIEFSSKWRVYYVLIF